MPPDTLVSTAAKLRRAKSARTGVEREETI